MIWLAVNFFLFNSYDVNVILCEKPAWHSFSKSQNTRLKTVCGPNRR